MPFGLDKCRFVSQRRLDFRIWNDKIILENMYLKLCETPSKFWKVGITNETIYIQDCEISSVQSC